MEIVCFTPTQLLIFGFFFKNLAHSALELSIELFIWEVIVESLLCFKTPSTVLQPYIYFSIEFFW